jgi:hypothetical protein
VSGSITALQGSAGTAQWLVKDDNDSFEAQTVILAGSTDTTITFAQAVRLVHVKNFDTTTRVKVKDGAITSDSDATASWVGAAPVTNVPCSDWFPFATTTLHLRSAAASEVVVEGFF